MTTAGRPDKMGAVLAKVDLSLDEQFKELVSHLNAVHAGFYSYAFRLADGYHIKQHVKVGRGEYEVTEYTWHQAVDRLAEIIGLKESEISKARAWLDKEVQRKQV